MPSRGGDLQIHLEPTVLRWARERARLTAAELASRVGLQIDRIRQWEETGDLSVRHSERLAHATHVPIGYLYLAVPPDEPLPIPDFRIIAGHRIDNASPDLLDVIDDAMLRQSWYRDYAIRNAYEPLEYVGSLVPTTSPQEAATRISVRHRLDSQLRSTADSWEEALRLEIERLEETGLLVMRSGIVGNNTSRPLSVDEFRGFAVADSYAPIVFLNARDAKAAQVFTLMHELVHVWLGSSGVSNLNMTLPPEGATERFSNRVAAELLVPSAELENEWALRRGPTVVSQLARVFKVSSLVILRRLFDLGKLDFATFRDRYEQEEARFVASGSRDDSGGDFYRTQTARASRRFASALIAETLEGRTPQREAFRLLGIRSPGTFEEFARRLGLAA